MFLRCFKLFQAGSLIHEITVQGHHQLPGGIRLTVLGLGGQYPWALYPQGREAAGDAVAQAALVAHFLTHDGGQATATQDVITHQQGKYSPGLCG